MFRRSIFLTKKCPYLCLEIAITAVDAIKGAVDAGKRSRETDKEENWKPGDFIRGLIQVAKETTSDGAAKRGKLHEKGNVIDWTVGATSNTTEYVLTFLSRFIFRLYTSHDTLIFSTNKKLCY